MIQPRRIAQVALIAAIALLTSAAAQQTVLVEHAQGTTEVTLRPAKVFSFDYATIDTLTALGIAIDGAPPLAGVGADRYDLSNAVVIGTLFEPDYEVIAAERPDLIIVSSRAGPAYPQLSRLAPTIDLSFQTDDFLGSLERNVRSIAAIFDIESEAQTHLDAIMAQVADLREAVAEGGSGLVVMVGGGSLSALGPAAGVAGRGSLLYETLGLVPPVADIEAATHGEPISFEFLVQHDPSHLFVIDRDAAIGAEGGQPAAAVLDHPLLHGTTFWSQGNVTYLDPFDWYIVAGAGLASMQRMLDQVAAAYAD